MRRRHGASSATSYHLSLTTHHLSPMKLFTVEEANALLPTVRGIVRQVQRAYSRVAASQEAARVAAEKAKLGGGGIAGGSLYVSALSDLAEQAGQLAELVLQLQDY